MSNNPAKAIEKKSTYMLFNMPWYYFAIFSAMVLVAAMMGVLPAGMAGGFAFMIVFGTVFQEIGDRCRSSGPIWAAAPSS